jgi:S1-C subfamily serine protease
MAAAVLISARMQKKARMIAFALASLLTQACSITSPPPPDLRPPGDAVRRIVAERVTAVVVTERNNLDGWVNRKFAVSQAPRDADGGSAAPITPDGYFLTADHVLSRLGERHVFLICGQGGRLAPAEARVVWRSKSADVALLHAPLRTPFFYRWTAPDRWLPAGNRVIHGGISTGSKSAAGKLATAIPPEGHFTRHRRFKIDIPLQPGDSGGPVVDASGQLVGINSAVEFLVPLETPFFIDSEGNRPNTRQLAAVIAKDRRRHDPLQTKS